MARDAYDPQRAGRQLHRYRSRIARATVLLKEWQACFGGSTYPSGKVCEPDLEARTQAFLDASQPQPSSRKEE